MLRPFFEVDFDCEKRLNKNFFKKSTKMRYLITSNFGRLLDALSRCTINDI